MSNSEALGWSVLSGITLLTNQEHAEFMEAIDERETTGDPS